MQNTAKYRIDKLHAEHG